MLRPTPAARSNSPVALTTSIRRVLLTESGSCTLRAKQKKQNITRFGGSRSKAGSHAVEPVRLRRAAVADRSDHLLPDLLGGGGRRSQTGLVGSHLSSNQTRLFTVDASGDAGIGKHTKWAPDESGLDYVVTRNGVSNIWRQPLTGGPPVQITRFSAAGFQLRGSADGRRLSFGGGLNRSDVVFMSSEP